MTNNFTVNSQIIPYLVGGMLVTFFIRKHFDVKDVLILAGIGYVAFTAYSARSAESVAAESATQQVVRESVPTSATRRGREFLAQDAAFSPILAELYNKFGRSNTVLREASSFLARFAAYYRAFSENRVVYDLAELQHIDWTMRMAINALLSLDVQVRDQRPFQRGKLYPKRCDRSLYRHVRHVDHHLRRMFTEMRSFADVDPENFEVAPTNSWEEPHAHHWKLV